MEIKRLATENLLMFAERFQFSFNNLMKEFQKNFVKTKTLYIL